MKIFLSLMIALTSLSAFATCPQGTTELLSCKSTPKKGDSQVVSQIADEIGICQKGKKIQIAIVADGTGAIGNAAVMSTVGATVYTLADEQDSPFSFSVGSRPFPGGVRMAKLSAQLGEETVSSTFTCR